MHGLEDHTASWGNHEAIRRDQPGHHRGGQQDEREDTGVGEEEPLQGGKDDPGLGGAAREGAGPAGQEDHDQGPAPIAWPDSPADKQGPLPKPGWNS